VRQVAELVFVWLQRRQVEEHGRSLTAALALQRQRDQVADRSRARQEVLGREQPVVAGQVQLPADRHRLTYEARADPASRRGRHSTGEKHPDVGSRAGTGDLQCRRDVEGPGRLGEGERVQERQRAVEVASEEAASVSVHQRVQAGVDGAGKMSGDDLVG